MNENDVVDKFKEEKDLIDRNKSIKELHSSDVCAISLSGGGIRSATFSLGVLQAISECDKDCCTVEEGNKSYKNSFLARFDYLSTVSGGGYIGGFLSSLFLGDRRKVILDCEVKSESEKNLIDASGADLVEKLDSANNAIKVLSSGIPPREIDPSDKERFPLAWLRNNGKYLLPSGTGDLSYAVTIVIRNLISLHYVIGIFILSCALLIMPIRCYLGIIVFGFGAIVAVMVIGYWLVRPGVTGTFKFDFALKSLVVSLIFLIPLYVKLMCSFDLLVLGFSSSSPFLIILSVLIVLFVAALYLFLLTIRYKFFKKRDLLVPMLRREMTLHLSNVSLVFFIFFLVYLIDMLVFQISSSNLQEVVGGFPVLAGAAAYIQRFLSMDKDRNSRFHDLIVAGLAAIAVFCLIAFWYWVAFCIHNATSNVNIFNFSVNVPANVNVFNFPANVRVNANWLVFLGSFIALSFSAYYSQFINVSSLHSFYTAKLIRAFMGGANSRRSNLGQTKDKGLAVSEPEPGDDFCPDEMKKGSIGPLHIVNVTLNQTVGSAAKGAEWINESIVLRDRKGRPLAITCCGNYLEGVPIKNLEPLSFGSWLGISGAAFSTGIGRQTMLSRSLLMGLANIRLGYWCEAEKVSGFFSWIYESTYRYVLYELSATFKGKGRRFVYLTDGGHYENTGVYELLRSERNVKFILGSDNGADPEYVFDDLANLIRLAKADLDVAIEVYNDFSGFPALAPVFGELNAFNKSTDLKEKNPPVALLLKATNLKKTEKVTWIALIKPRYSHDVPVDIWNYVKGHSEFPQEPTADQFFDEAQWESYRALGYFQCTKILSPEVWKELKKLCNLN